MKLNKSKIVYLVLCWNNKDIISECLDSLINQTYKDKKIYVLDNASTDGSSDFIADNYPDIELIRSSKNNGFDEGNNILIEKSLQNKEVRYVALINSDLILKDNWTEEIVNYISNKHNVAGAQGATLDYYNHKKVDSVHVYLADNLQSIQYGYNEPFTTNMKFPRKVFGVNAAAAIYTRDFIEKQPCKKFFDNKFYMYLEDVDISLRAIVSGRNNYYIPSAVAYHMGSASSKKRASDYAFFMTFRNQAALLFKNLSFLTIFKFIPRGINTDLHLYKWLKTDYGCKIAVKVFWARVWGIIRLPLYISDRIRIRKAAKRNNQEIERVIRQKGIF